MPKGIPKEKEVNVGVLEKVKPGTVVGNRKTPWTMQDIAKLPKVTFTPDENVTVTFNGLAYYLVADKEVVVPENIKFIYDEYKRSSRRAGTPPPGIEFHPGVGGLPQV